MILFKNISDNLKTKVPNVYIIIISSLIALWFHYFNLIAEHYLPRKGIYTKWIMFGIVTGLLYLGDGSLNELYRFDHTGAVVASQNQNDTTDDTKNVRPAMVKRR